MFRKHTPSRAGSSLELPSSALTKNFKLPPPTLEEFESLVQSIRKYGIQDAVIYTESGELVAGENRQRAAELLGIKEKDVPKKIIPNRSTEDVHELRVSLNVVGRQVSTETKKELAKIKLIKDPSLSSRSIAELLGLDKNTVQRLKEELQAVGEIHQPQAVKGKDGKSYKKVPPKTAGGKEKAKTAVSRKQKKEVAAQPKAPKKEKSKPTIAPGEQVYSFYKNGPSVRAHTVLKETKLYYYVEEGGRIEKRGSFPSFEECKRELVSDLEYDVTLAQFMAEEAKALKPPTGHSKKAKK